MPGLEVLISGHLTRFLELFPGERLLPKHHFMVHYCRLMGEIGPLYLSSCMKFEMKHGFFKRCAHIVCNFRNIPKSLAYSHQYYSAYVFMTSLRSDATVFESGSGNLLPTCNIPHLADLSLPHSIAELQAVFSSNKLNFRGIWYHVGDFLATNIDVEFGDPSFIQITAIINCSGEWNFVVRKCKTLDFLSHFHCYSVKLLKVAVMKWKLFYGKVFPTLKNLLNKN